MNFTKKIDRAFQWAGEKMGHEAKTSQSDEFKSLETEMALRHDGYDRLQKSMNVYVKSLSRRGETFEDKEKGLPVSYLGRTMMTHGEDFEPDSEFGNCLIAMGRGNERIAGIQETYVAHATSYWLEGLERSLAMMKEYQSARKKLENRRLTYDACMIKMQKTKREDFRLEDELRTAKAKYEESSEDVLRRMQDIKEAEADSVRDLTCFLDSELDYYERCAEELRRVKQEWVAGQGQPPVGPRPGELSISRRPTNRSRSNTAQSYSERNNRTEQWASRQDIYEEPAPEPVRMPIRSSPYRAGRSVSPEVQRPSINRASTHGGAFEGPSSRQSTYREPPPPPPESLRKTPTAPPLNVGALRNNLRPVNRIQTNQNLSPDVYVDEYDTATSSGSPEYDRSESPATSYGSLSRTPSNNGLRTSASPGSVKKAPPPPPPSRAKKPAPPVPARREIGY
ncbi:BAR-domain-containing protein [Hypoxylon trugodes]|uniref:BAR-domain-containing protein n=1 Tax=Hypoxylon trugodes TaxID=326681 RepID=UPI0021971501|nr:BAR-domain-containing protein [Hypoxylon trugodes]KAI1390489.1 BAR-domain-containing protein [Hypoxylon trugodes]